MNELVSAVSDTALLTSLAHLTIGAVLAILLQVAYVKFGTSLSNRREFARIFPMITLAVIVVITVVKTSLALSLGLIGALSIVRFRTPIKEPEELAFLFITIAIGIGLGADQIAFTVVSAGFMLLVIVLLDISRKGRFRGQNLYVTVRWSAGDEAPEVKTIADALAGAFRVCDIRRVDTSQTDTRASFHVEAASSDQVFSFLDRFKADYPGLDIAVIEHHRVPGA